MRTVIMLIVIASIVSTVPPLEPPRWREAGKVAVHVLIMKGVAFGLHPFFYPSMKLRPQCPEMGRVLTEHLGKLADQFIDDRHR